MDLTKINWTHPKRLVLNQKLFGRSKIILDHSNHFGRVHTNHFGQVQFVLVQINLDRLSKIIKISPEKSNLTLTKMLWTQPKRFGPDQNDWYSTIMIWTVQNHFRAIEEQGRAGGHELHTI